MSANLDLVRSIYADWERGDYSGSDWADPEIEFVFGTGEEGLLPGIRTGLAGMADAYREWLGAWEGAHSEADKFRELDRKRVVVLDRRSGRGKKSGLDISSRGATLFHVCEGKVTRLVVYGSRDRAFADLGLTPEDPATSP